MTESLFSSLNRSHFITKTFAAASASYANEMWKWFVSGGIWLEEGGGSNERAFVRVGPQNKVM